MSWALTLLLALGLSSASADTRISRIRIESPLGQGHSIFLRGNGGGLSWGAGGARSLVQTEPGVWQLELDLESPIEIKPLLDNTHWMITEKNLRLEPGASLELVEPEFEGARSGTVETLRIHGKVIRMYLPPHYRRGSGTRYPVIYMQDGDKLFGGEGSWRVNGTVDQMIHQGRMSPTIVVGVDPTSAELRMNELTPFPGIIPANEEQTRFEVTGGGLPEYSRQVAELVKPAVDAMFDTLAGAENTTIGGSSLGGMGSLVAAVLYPESFGDVIALSGTWLWGDAARAGDGSILRVPGDPSRDLLIEPHFSAAQFIREQLARNMAAGRRLPRVFISVGAQEWPVMQRATARMVRELEAIGFKVNENMFLYRDPLGRHSERSWAWQLRVPLTALRNRDLCRRSLLPGSEAFFGN